MRIKVCLIIPTLVQGGAEKQLTLLARNLNPESFDVSVIVLTHSGPYEADLTAAGIALHFIDKKGKLDWFAYRRLVRKLRELKPDIVHSWLFAANSYGRAAALRAKVPVIVGAERSVDPWKSRWQFAIDRWLAKRTHGLLTNTSAVADFYQAHGIDRDQFTIIANGIEPTETVKLSRDEACRRLGLPTRGRLIGSVGRLWAQKGYADLIWAGEMLHVAYEDMWYVIVGDGPDFEKLQHLRDKAQAFEAVRFVGHRSDAREIMSAFDVLWNGSLYEGQSNTILEAMSLGVPVVASDIPGTRDLIEHGESGYLYPRGNAAALAKLTNQLLTNDEVRRSLASGAARRVQEEFSVTRMVREHEEYYRRLWKAHTAS
ncbi:MAG: glycosyltransferase [Planctomycetales bacterium]|nr:glycosyltransferase [Planctomycetales bacterium]